MIKMEQIKRKLLSKDYASRGVGDLRTSRGGVY